VRADQAAKHQLRLDGVDESARTRHSSIAPMAGKRTFAQSRPGAPDGVPVGDPRAEHSRLPLSDGGTRRPRLHSGSRCGRAARRPTAHDWLARRSSFCSKAEAPRRCRGPTQQPSPCFLEPGTPRFSGSRGGAIPLTKDLQIHDCQSDAVWHDGVGSGPVPRRFGTPPGSRSPNEPAAPSERVDPSGALPSEQSATAGRLPRLASLTRPGRDLQRRINVELLVCDARVPEGNDCT
jgi:hypothetical protein